MPPELKDAPEAPATGPVEPNWAELTTESELEEPADSVEETSEAAPPEAPPAPADAATAAAPVEAPATAPAEATALATAAPPVQPAAATAPPEQPVAPQPEAPAPRMPSAEEWEAHRKQLGADLEKAYALSEDDAALMQTDPEKVLPKLAAELHVRIVEAAVSGIMAHLPHYIRNTMSQQAVHSDAETKFYSQFKELDKPEYRETVRRISQNYRMLNPTASLDDAIREVGATAMVALRLGGGAPAPAIVPQAPFTPAAPGFAAGAVQARNGTKNEFEILAEEMLREDSF